MGQGNRRMVGGQVVVVTKDDVVCVGLDVHVKSFHVAIWKNGQIVWQGVIPAKAEVLIKLLAGVRAGLKKVVYEAGPTGYGLARALAREGIPVEVAAPSEIKRKSGKEAKSDRIDSRKLAEMASKGDLKYVRIPTEEEEADRQVVRLRDQLVDRRRKARQQIRGFMLQYGLETPRGLNQWSRKAVEELAAVPLRRELRYCLDKMLEEEEALRAKIQEIEKEISRLANEKRYVVKMDLVCSHPGVGRTVAMEFLTEVYRPGRFAHAGQVSKYVGLAPLRWSTGETAKDLGTNKSGRKRLRSMLIEAAWTWVRHDARARATYKHLAAQTASGKKAIVAMARKLVVNLWTMLCDGTFYREAA